MKIWAQVNKALYPFSNRTHVLMDGPGKIQRKHRGDLELSFYERVLLELPRDKVRRFVYPIGSDPEPEEAEFAKWRRLLLGTARRILVREQVQQIKNLPHLPGTGRGINENTQTEILRTFEVLKENRTARQAVTILAERHGYTERNVWKILSRMRKAPG